MRQLTFLLLLFALLASTPLRAQVKVPEIDTTKLVNPADLIIAYEETSQLLRDVSNALITDYKTKEIEQNYFAVADEIENYIRIGGQNLDKSSLSRIDDLIIIFERLRSEVEGWQETLTTYSKDLSNQKIEIIKSKMRLSVDINALSERGEEYYNDRFVPIFAQADSLENQIDVRLEDILGLEYTISQDYVMLLNRIEELKSYRRDYWTRITQKEEIDWSNIFGSEGEEFAFIPTESKLGDTWWRIADFFRVHPTGNIILIVFMTGFYLMLRRFKKVDKEETDEEKRHPQLYAFPIAQSLLVGGMLFPVVYPPTTTLMYDFVVVIAYLPFMWILYNILEWKLFRRYLLFFALFLLMKIVFLIFVYSIFTNIIVTIGGVVFLLTLLGHTIREQLKIRFKYVLLFNWVLRVILVVGVGFMLIERLSLGRILINGAGETIAISLVLIYLANWMDHLIDYIKARPYIQRLGNNKAHLNDYFETLRSRLYLLLFFLFIIAFLRDFNLLGGVKDNVYEFFTSDRKIGELVFSYGGIALFFLTLYLSTKISSSIKFLTEDKSYFKNQKKTANISVMVRFFLVTGGFVLALLVSGIPIDRITIILGALSVGIGFGLQNIVNNLISGLILIFERPIQSGDLVELQQYMGVVKDIGIRSSVIRTYDGAEVIVPNGNLISQEVINWTLSNQHRRIELLVGVTYGSDTEKVAEIMRAPILAHDKVLKLPQPLVLFNGFGDSSLDFRLLFWTSDIDNWLRTKSEVTHEIYKALNESGVEIPFPQRDLHIRSWEGDAIIPDSSKPPRKAATTPKKKAAPKEENEGEDKKE